MSVWEHISVVFVDALRDVDSELRKPKNPIRQMINAIEGDIAITDIEDVKNRITELNQKIAGITQIGNIEKKVNKKLLEMIGMVYSPDITLDSRLQGDLTTLSRYLTIRPTDQTSIDLLGLGHLNILYIALKLVEFELNRSRELLNIMIIEEPEAHIHTHIQKTLFDNLKVDQSYTQVIMTTHSTHISQVSDIEKVNIMKKEDNKSIVMRPTNGLDEFGVGIIDKSTIGFTKILSRYLDAKRSVLLFSKGVILVEGDGEEILIPSLVKKVLGVTLDEIGIGLINIGSVAFENVACIFDKIRLQRRCAIITDLDTKVNGAKHSTEKAMKLGSSRRDKLTDLFKDNEYVKAFYAPHTLEYDFATYEDNKDAVYAVINYCYTQRTTIDNYCTNIKKGTPAELYDSVLTVAETLKKGWYATLLASVSGVDSVIPDYILEALAFAVKDVINEKILLKMVNYGIDNRIMDSEENKQIELALKGGASSWEEQKDIIPTFCESFKNDMVSAFIKKVGSLNG